jgi:hypothetical protein
MRMKVVIQCAARKHPSAGSLQLNGKRILFVAQPHLAPPQYGVAHVRPDDVADGGETWRDRLLRYNVQAENPLGLLPAFRLYANDTFRALAARFGEPNLFILSAGWGLISAGFLTPQYDITFTAQADAWKRRRRGDRYRDFQMLPDDGEPIAFLGGKDYLPPFCALTSSLVGRKTVFFNQARTPDLPDGFAAVRYRTSTRTNWHYECARELIADRVSASAPRASF